MLVKNFLMDLKRLINMGTQLISQIHGDNNTKFLIMMDTHFTIQVQG